MRTPLMTVFFAALAGAALVGVTPQVPQTQQTSQVPAAPPQPPPALAAVTPDSQMPPVTFRAEINYVEVDAVALDASGTFVRDLKKEDFRILEDGKPQQISAFSLVNIPVRREDQPLFMTRQVEPDVFSNVGPPEGRLYVIVLDDLHTDMRRTLRVRRAARQFIERNLGSNDLAAVVRTGGGPSQDFTSNRRLLLEAVDRFAGRKLLSPTLGKMDQYALTRNIRQTGDPLNDPNTLERGHNARTMLVTLRNLSDWLASIHGRRKAVVVISEGIDYDVHDFMNNIDSSSILDSTRDVIAAATRGNVQLYTIDPRGLTAMGDEQMEMQAITSDDPAVANLGMASLYNELRLSQDSLRVLADQTGGFATVNANEFERAFPRIVDENSTYYVLGYYPTNDRRDGRFRRIEVRVERPGVEVRARKGYVAPRGKAPSSKAVEASAGTSAKARQALDSPIQVSGLRMAAAAAPFRGPGNTAAVALVTQVDPANFEFKEKDGKLANTLELSFVVVDPNGKVKAGNRETVTMGLKPETFERARKVGFRVQSRFEVAPGKYQIRLAATESGGQVGTVLMDLVVPDFTKDPLGMSGLVLSSAYAGGVPTAGTIPEVKDLLPGPVTTARNFARGDELAVMAEVYDNLGNLPHSVEIVTSLLEEGGKVALTQAERRASSELGGARGGYGYLALIPLKDVAPGQYVLRVEARSTLKDGGTASRETLIRIVP